jgi:hypothetical protein
VAWWQEKSLRIEARNEASVLRNQIEQQEFEFADLRVRRAVGPDCDDWSQLWNSGRFVKALSISERELKARSEFYGEHHRLTIQSQLLVGVLKCLTNQHDTAEPHLLAFLEQPSES